MARTPKWKRLRWSHEHWSFTDHPAKARRMRWVKRFNRKNQTRFLFN